MANHKSALKRIGQDKVRTLRNKAVKTRVKSALKAVRAAVEEKSQEKAAKELCLASSVLQKAAKKGVIHRNTASRKISRLTKLVNKLSA